MMKYDDMTFLIVKYNDGDRFLCPINSSRSNPAKQTDLNDECIEEDVVQRYA